MSRVIRHQQPGCVFHITSRTQGHEPWFTANLRGPVVSMIVDGVASAGAALIAYAVMPNHLHIILAQGHQTLGWTLQPILRRIALLVQRAHGVTGHVFERRFRSKPCLDQDYVRTAVLYTHFNPVKAGICSSIHDYSWTSHPAYCSEGEAFQGIIPDDALRLFAADGRCTSRDELRRDYLAHVDAWQRVLRVSSAPPSLPPPNGSSFFAQRFCTQLDHPHTLARIDLRDRAQRILQSIARDCDLDLLRGSYVGRHAAEIRRQLIAALLTADYPGSAIAHFFKISPSVVSRISTQMRWHRS